MILLAFISDQSPYSKTDPIYGKPVQFHENYPNTIKVYQRKLISSKIGIIQYTTPIISVRNFAEIDLLILDELVIDLFFFKVSGETTARFGLKQRHYQTKVNCA